MDFKRFNAITKEVLLDYGFRKINPRKYVIRLEHITILLEMCSYDKSKKLAYSFSFNALDNTTDPPTNIENGRFDNLFTKTLVVDYSYNPKWGDPWLRYEEYTEEYYRDLLTNLIKRYFDPFKKDTFELFRTDVGLGNTCTRQARKFLGLE